MLPTYHYWKGIAYSTAAAVMWAILPIFLKMALRQSDPLTIVWLRFFIAFILLTCLALIKKPTWFSILQRPPLVLWGAALMLAFNYIGYMMGVKYTTPSVAQVVIQFGPLLLAIGGTVLFKEKFKIVQWCGLGLFISGFIFFYRDQAHSILQNNLSLGVLWILIAAVVWSLYALGQKSLVAFHPPQSLNIFIFLLSTIIYAPFASYSSMMNYSLFTWFVLLLCGLNTFIAYGAVAEAIKCMPAAIVSVIISLNPLLTMIIMKFINQSEILGTNNDLREALGSTGLWGASLLIAGAVLIIAGPKIKTEALRFRFTK